MLPSEDLTKEVLELKKENEKLTKELKKNQSFAPEGTEDLSSGDDLFEVNYNLSAVGEDWKIQTVTYTSKTSLSWNQMFAEISPLMIDETTEESLKQKINVLIRKMTVEKLTKDLKKEKRHPESFSYTTLIFKL